ncbi:rust resistance kinase Lr10-like [Rhododendron vialii]|uniref:rust resistance kinase Lr10-like n=1 Tax=Rhododendron vialii TaxID=182163 RepID=UPI00265F95B5|nr:rust resistance kinase Lr10-like [Rhododendron vialii]XP_058219361.1 rust resistance kinase Lr10-like [Rhododendron vialii]
MEELHTSVSLSTKNNLMIFLFLFFFFLLLAGVGAQADDHNRDDECLPKRCGAKGPEIRFPFWLKGHQPERCGYGPGFALTCSPTENKETLLDYPFSFKVVVKQIKYDCQLIRYEFSSNYDPHQQNLSLILNTSPFSPFQLWLNTVRQYEVFYCRSYSGRPGHNLFLMNSDYLITRTLLNCSKMHTLSVPCFYLHQGLYDSEGLWGWSAWSEPSCRKCEENGTYCRLSSRSNHSKMDETECFDIPKPGETKKPHHETGLIPISLFALVVLVIATYFVHGTNNSKKEDQVKIERFLEDYRALKPSRYTYAEIKKITHNFKYKLGQGGYGIVYKGELSKDVPIAAKILNNFTGNGDDFINEVGTIGTIHHVNVVRLVGYCADGYKKALVYEFLPNDSLEKFISSDHKRASLGWQKLQDIALGIAKGIEYLHQGCDQRILHFDIKPHNILLDKNFIPKISDFGLAKLCSKEQSVVSMTAARGTVGYIAPEVFSRNFGNVSHKSDVYSFGMLLLEMVGGRKKNIDVRAEENSDEVYFPEWIYNRLNCEEVNNNEVEEGGDAKIVKKLTVVGLWCIQWYPGDRPSMKVVVQMLEGDGDTLGMPPNPFSTTNESITRGNMGGRHFSSILEIISESD